VTTIWPLELTEAVDLRIDKVASVDIMLVLFGQASPTRTSDYFTPLFKSFTLHLLISSEASGDFNCTEFKFLDALAAHLVLNPVSVVLRAIEWLPVTTRPME